MPEIFGEAKEVRGIKVVLLVASLKEAISFLNTTNFSIDNTLFNLPDRIGMETIKMGQRKTNSNESLCFFH